MKLLRASFQNFRLLRDLELDFSSVSKKKLTVIRAANESGKTTILHALQWALYGDSALPGKGDGFRLHPIDWDMSKGKRVPITATVEFELTTHRITAGEMRETRQRFRLIRSTFEDVDSQSKRSPSTVKLFQLKDQGSSPMPSPESMIHDELPPDLREVFFTDGDRALSFIEADVALSTKRERVQSAIRSLLGLGVINNAIKHVRKSAAEVNKQAKQIGSDTELNKIASLLEDIEDIWNGLEDDLKDAKQQFDTFEYKLNETDKKIAAALQKGDKEDLQRSLDRVNREIKQFEAQLDSANKEHSDLFKSQSIATDLLAPVLGTAFKQLEELHDQGKIPSTTIPVVRERLSTKICICGESLAPTDPEAKHRLDYINKLIEDSERSDETQEIITGLYYGTKPLQMDDTHKPQTWLNEYTKVVKRRDGIQALRDGAGRKLRGLELQLDALPDTDIQGLRDTRRQYKDLRDRYLGKSSSVETQLLGLKNDREKLERERNRLLREQNKGARILAELSVTQDVMKVLISSYGRITNEELAKVSELMNEIFLEMIGADPEQNAIIRRTKISHEFDIIVYGPKERLLNPDRDLNGASRRALTLAFILALTKVSEVEAPNVIDTPLGMTSGYVKRSILKTAVRESSQLVLFLTHDEIIGCEDIIDEAAGTVFTLTNPAHYPKMLVNEPDLADRKVIRCSCDHRSVCQLCERRTDAQIEL